MSNKLKNTIAVLVILFLAVLLQKDHISEFPLHTHAWAQTDRYALALGFNNNDFNFFKPETFVLNKQFPYDWHYVYGNSITAVDFPIHDYIVGIIMKMTGNTSPIVFRLYILFYGLIGLFFLFKLTNLLTDNLLYSLFVTVFAATSPVFVYYQAGFLPTIPSLANAIIGVYFYLYYYHKQKSEKYFHLSVFFLTLSALSRTTFAICLLSVFGTELILILRRKSELHKKIIPVALSLISLFAYFLYNSHLRKLYGSIFLNHFLPPHNLTDVKDVLDRVYDNWLWLYFSKIHYILLFVLCITPLLHRFFKNKNQQANSPLALLVGIMFAGCVSFSALMLLQFSVHDYYFLDTFFLPVVLLVIAVFSKIPPLYAKKLNLTIISIALFISGILLSANAFFEQKIRYQGSYYDRSPVVYDNFKNSGQFLDSLKIPKDASILVPDPLGPNFSHILMNRKGAVIMPTFASRIKEATTWTCDYAVIENDFFMETSYPLYPEIINHLTKIADNGKISVCKFSRIPTKKTLFTFLQLSKQNSLISDSINFETPAGPQWTNVEITEQNTFNGHASCIVSNNSMYGITYKKYPLEGLNKEKNLLYVSGFFNMPERKEILLSVTINSNGKGIYFTVINIADKLKQNESWQEVEFLVKLPSIKEKDVELGVFIYNPKQTKLLIDDFKVKLY